MPSCCNPGFCCCSQNVGKIPTTLLPGSCQLPGHATNIYCSVMSDTVGLVWRGFTGTVDPWTKNNIVTCNAAQLQKASAGSLSKCQATAAAQTSATNYLVSVGGDPSQASCGLKSSLDKFLSDIESVLLWAGIGAVVLILAYAFIVSSSRQ